MTADRLMLAVEALLILADGGGGEPIDNSRQTSPLILGSPPV